MKFDPFIMERWQSTYEHRVRFNLSESGVHPLSVSELLSLAGTGEDALRGVRLGYGQSNGSDELRSRIAALYPGADESNVLVTVGGAEANFTAFWHLMEPGGAAAVALPNYMQVPGLLTSFGARVLPFHLIEEEGWQPDVDQLRASLGDGARFILVTNPNNPTGAALTAESMEAIVNAAAEHGAWILCDEIYQGAEVGDTQTPSFWGMYDRVLITNSLSKAYGLPGLRLGWVLGPSDLIGQVWGRTDYTTIAPASLSDSLAVMALEPGTRTKILERTGSIIRNNLRTMTAWMEGQQGRFSYREPDAGAICYVRYSTDVNSSEFAEILRTEHKLLVVPGDHFGMDRYMRLGFGLPNGELVEALSALKEAFDVLEA